MEEYSGSRQEAPKEDWIPSLSLSFLALKGTRQLLERRVLPFDNAGNLFWSSGVLDLGSCDRCEVEIWGN